MTWIMCPTFFVSVVAYVEPPTEARKLVAPRVLIRARLRSHLESLVELHGKLLGAVEIQESPKADYPFRLSPVPRTAWGKVMAAIAESAIHTNFKAAAAAEEHDPERRYSTMLHEVWFIARQHLQFVPRHRPLTDDGDHDQQARWDRR